MTSDGNGAPDRQRSLMVALFLISASTLHFEVLLTKFFANKLEHHFTYVIISIALLGFGASGVYVQLRSKLFSADQAANASTLWRYAVSYAISQPLSVAIFLVLPLFPHLQDWRGALALPIYFLLFAVPFFFAGVCVTALFVAKGLRPSRVYAWDLSGAALGAVFGVLLLPAVGGFRSVLVATALATIGAVIIRARVPKGAVRAGALGVAAIGFASMPVLQVPAILRTNFDIDMLSYKHVFVRAEFKQFGAVTQIYWNPIARVEVSETGTSHDTFFRFGLPRRQWQRPLKGRLILADSSANTRQFLFDERPERTGVLGSSLFAAPYVLRPQTKRTLIIGPGGGVDILTGKAFGVTEIDAVELNPDMYRLVTGRPEDPEREAYTRWLTSDEATRVNVFNAEARHFVHSRPDSRPYQVVLASGVDTLTAIQTAGNSLAENFLYTREAVEDYMAVLEPGGLLALTHWHIDAPPAAPTLLLRMLTTYLEVLEDAGAPLPGARVCVISEGSWASNILKKDEDFTREEIARLQQWAAASSFQVVYHPFMAEQPPILRAHDGIFHALARADSGGREKVLEALPWDVSPATDDRPFFYWMRKNHEGLTASDDGGFIYPQASVRWMFLLALALSLAMVLCPWIVLWRRGQPVGRALRAVPFFAATGFAFVLAENAMFLMLTLFVGGPLYSLAVVLPSILVGYSIGSIIAGGIASRTRRGGLLLAAIYLVGFLLFGAAVRWGLPPSMGSDGLWRVVLAVVLVTPLGMLLGLAAPWYMERLKADERMRGTLAWMWGVSSAANVIGSLMFVPLCQQLGVRNTFAVAAGLYAVALLAAALVPAFSQTAEAEG